VEWRALDAIGRSGGILIMWNPNKISIIDYIVGTFSVSIHFKNYIDNFSWLLSGVYASCNVAQRRRIRKELSLMKDIWTYLGAYVGISMRSGSCSRCRLYPYWKRISGPSPLEI
ncbi:hypothetical protein MKX01_008374, partial [Papaver californicum]